MEAELKHETIVHGVAASPGIAMGSAFVYVKETPTVEERTLPKEEIEAEVDRYTRAVDKSVRELNKILIFAQQKVGDAKAKILEAQIMVLLDQYLVDAITKRIRGERKNAEYIVHDEIGKYARLMLAAHDEYMHERAHDMDDLRNRIIRNLHQEKLISRLEGTMIVLAHSLTPADTMILSRNHVLGYATDLGGVTSHAAVFSRSLKIPAVVGLGDVTRKAITGDSLIIDGYSGTLVLHPSDATVSYYEQKRKRLVAFEAKLAGLKGLPAKTVDGHKIELSANIELAEELEYVVIQGSQGVGLYRTESLLIDRDDFPTEDEQYREYKKIVDRIYPRRVVMRTFDIGGDKIAPEMAEESNPFLGWRGIRICFDRPDLFMNQLRAMLRASTRKNLAIMFPMVSTISEVRKAREFVEQAKTELKAKKIKFDPKVPIGVMIEVPSAAINAHQIAAEVDFLSVGSNDLTQYLLAVDRGNRLVAGLYKEFDPSLLSMLRHVIDAAHRHSIWVGICGELAGNPLATVLLTGLGMDELSVVPSVLPEIKKIIRTLKYTDVCEIANKALTMTSSDDIKAFLLAYLKKTCPDIPLENWAE